MEKLKIKSVTSINQQDSKSFIVGCDDVVEIRDNSLEYEDHIHVQFDAYNKKGQIIRTFINGAYSIEYYQ